MWLPVSVAQEVEDYGHRKWVEVKSQGAGDEFDEGSHLRTEQNCIESLGAEVYVCLLMGVEWEYRPRPDSEGDVGPGLQVRYTPWPKNHLLLRGKVSRGRSDNPGHTFFLVTQDFTPRDKFPYYMIRGWIRGFEGMKNEYWGKFDKYPNRPPCWQVPQEALHPFHEWERERNINRMYAKSRVYDPE
jgi:hypothetical protein